MSLPIGNTQYNRVDLAVYGLSDDSRSGLTRLDKLSLSLALEGPGQLLHMTEHLLSLCRSRAYLNVNGKPALDLDHVQHVKHASPGNDKFTGHPDKFVVRWLAGDWHQDRLDRRL
jgi:hypothetical protein